MNQVSFPYCVPWMYYGFSNPQIEHTVYSQSEDSPIPPHSGIRPSHTSFVVGETPSKSNYNKSRRIQRGLFRVNDGSFINADVNGSFQIMKKVIPNEEILWDRGCAYQPIVVAVE